MKTQTLLKSIFGVAFIAVLLLMVSCDTANPSALVGRWIRVSDDEGKGDIIDLLSDGTGVLSHGSLGVAFTWKTENGRFFTTFSNAAQSESYKLQGSVLTLTEDNGKISEWTKCGKKNCQEVAEEYANAKYEKAKAEAKKEAEERTKAVKKAIAAREAGSISGTVIDQFSGKAVELPTVWIKGTTFISQKMPDGKFKFEGVPVSDSVYTLVAGKPKYSQGQVKFLITKDNLDVVQNIYISKQDVNKTGN